MNTVIIVAIFSVLLLVAIIAIVLLVRKPTVNAEAEGLKSLLQAREEVIRQKDNMINGLTNREAELKQQLSECKRELQSVQADLAATTKRLDETTGKNAFLTAETARMEERIRITEEEFRQRKQVLDEMHKTSTEQFKNIANEIFKTHTEAFQDASQRNLRQLIDPLKENIETFKKQIGEVYGNEARERFSLQNEIKNLIDLNRSIGEEAQHLTRALRGDTKVQGDWGEMILERLLEMSGLQRDVHFKTQVTTNDDGSKILSSDGRQLRPDVVVYYPDGRCVVVDSKVSLTAYVDYVNLDATDSDAIDEAGKRHIVSIKKHITELSGKRYQDLIGDKKLDFVMMFIPNEGAYMTTMKLHPEVWQEAFEKRVLLTSPTHLIAALRMLEQLWKQDAATKNVQEIARLSGAMLDKFANVVTDLEGINKHLTAASAAYTQARRRLSEGNGNIIVTAKKIVALGAKTSKSAELNRLENSTDASLGNSNDNEDSFK